MITKLSDAPDGKERITKGLEGFEKKGIIAFLSECPIRADQRPAQPAVQPVEHPLEVEEPFEQAQVRGACSAAAWWGVWSGGVRGQPGSSPVGRWGVGGGRLCGSTPPPPNPPHPPTHAHTQLDLVDLGAGRDAKYRYVFVLTDVNTGYCWLRALSGKDALIVARHVSPC